MVGCELVISGRDTPTLLDLVEESFDQVARTIQIGAKADGVFDFVSAERSPKLPAVGQTP
jgi:hypothetical protein